MHRVLVHRHPSHLLRSQATALRPRGSRQANAILRPLRVAHPRRSLWLSTALRSESSRPSEPKAEPTGPSEAEKAPKEEEVENETEGDNSHGEGAFLLLLTHCIVSERHGSGCVCCDSQILVPSLLCSNHLLPAHSDPFLSLPSCTLLTPFLPLSRACAVQHGPTHPFKNTRAR